MDKATKSRTFVMMINLNLPPRILDAQTKAIKEENVEKENICGIDKEFETRPDGTLCIEKRSWLPRLGGLREVSAASIRTSSPTPLWKATQNEFRDEILLTPGDCDNSHFSGSRYVSWKKTEEYMKN
ncbi:hypothetical protein Tco_1546278 [Tanacetum coccineum]